MKIMKMLLKLLTILSLLALCSFELAQCNVRHNSPTIDIYINCDGNITRNLYNSNITIHKLHCSKSLDSDLNVATKGHSSSVAKRIAINFSKSNSDKYLRAFKEDQYAIISGVKYVPAIVFNHKYVVYGTSDINHANKEFQKYHMAI